MRRRHFLKTVAGGIALLPWLEQLVIGADGSPAIDIVSNADTDADIRSLFEATNEEVLAP